MKYFKTFTLAGLTLLTKNTYANLTEGLTDSSSSLSEFLNQLGEYAQQVLDYQNKNEWDDEQLQEWLLENADDVSGAIGDPNRGLNPRNVQLTAQLKTITTYGCYCYFEEDFMTGRGPVMDHIDGFCKKLGDGYTCAKHDDDSCNPNIQDYNMPNVGNVLSYVLNPTTDNMNRILRNCRDNNSNNSCAQAACQLEQHFIAQVTADVTLGRITQSNREKRGFDRAGTCFVQRARENKGGSGNGRDHPQRSECCGTIPDRFPYTHVDGRRECCVSHTYDAFLMQCCPDGTVATQCL